MRRQKQPANLNATKDYTFPDVNPQFSVIFASKKTAASSSFTKQQSITIYPITDDSTPVFKRGYYADHFNGLELTYVFATEAAAFTQRGSLASVGCKTNECKLPWSNFYTWDKQTKTFILDNTSHKDVYEGLVTEYDAFDTSALNSNELRLLQKAKAVAGEILKGKNLGSKDI